MHVPIKTPKDIHIRVDATTWLLIRHIYFAAQAKEALRSGLPKYARHCAARARDNLIAYNAKIEADARA